MIQWLCLAAMIGVYWICILGMWRSKTVYQRLHFTGPASTLGPALLLCAGLARPATGPFHLKIALLSALIFFAGPLIQHATARAAWIRERGSWKLASDLEGREDP